jgi:hypothetical protein
MNAQAQIQTPVLNDKNGLYLQRGIYQRNICYADSMKYTTDMIHLDNVEFIGFAQTFHAHPRFRLDYTNLDGRFHCLVDGNNSTLDLDATSFGKSLRKISPGEAAQTIRNFRNRAKRLESWL